MVGIGCNREITGIAAEVIETMNAVKAPILAIDVPSGISADTGKICGIAVNAETTVTFFAEKLGMMLYPGKEYCGEIIVADMGIPVEYVEECKTITYTDKDLEKLP